MTRKDGDTWEGLMADPFAEPLVRAVKVDYFTRLCTLDFWTISSLTPSGWWCGDDRDVDISPRYVTATRV
jgi:hypothetical protein